MSNTYKLLKMCLSVNILSILLSGCAQHIEFGNMSINGTKFSYIQWDEDHAVTVKHVQQLDSYVYLSGKYDIQFFEHSSKEIPKWTTPKANERLTMSGFHDNTLLQLEGHDLGLTIKPKQFPIPVYRAVDVSIKPGMSGGPVTNDAGQVVGMNIGFSKESYEKGDYTYKISVYVPYEIIQKEWENYQKILDEE